MKRNFICGNEEESVLLNGLIEGIADSKLKRYKEDVLLDLKAIRLNGKDHKSFIWFTRESGTSLMIEKFIHIIGTSHNSNFNYYKDSKINAYRIVVTKICPKNIYGYIEKINLKNYIETVKPKDKVSEEVTVRLTLKDKSKKELRIPFSEKCYYEVLGKLNLEDSNVERFEHLAFA